MTSGLDLLIAEFILIAAIIMSVSTSAFAGTKFKVAMPTTILVPALLFLGLYLILGGAGGGDVFDKSLLQIDGVSQYAKLLVSLITVGSILLGTHYLKSKEFDAQEHKADYFSVLLLSAVGIFTMVSASDLITFYMGLEIQSLALYILIAFKRDCAVASEAALKYLILGAVGSGLFLFGTSMIYGVSGSVHYVEFFQFETFVGANLFFVLGASLILMALFFKLSAAPFHMWTPDVYQGAPSFVTAFVATAPKISAVIGMYRLVEYAFNPIIAQLSDVIILASLLSLFVGAIMAVRQTSIYRMVAYSTVTHMGYILLALSTMPNMAGNIILEYLTVYVFTSFGIFTIIGLISVNNKSIDKISDFAGLARHKPYHALCLTILMLSLAGIPPLAGFFVKFNILSHVVTHSHVGFAFAAVAASAISAYYYIKVIKVIYFDEAEHEHKTSSDVLFAMGALCTLIIVLYVFNPSFVNNLVEYFFLNYYYE